MASAGRVSKIGRSGVSTLGLGSGIGCFLATTLEQELTEQRRWRLLPRWSKAQWHSGLARNEFLSAAEHTARANRGLNRILAAAVERVPYYRSLFERLGLTVESIRSPADLPALPVLTRSIVQEQAKRLRAESLPETESYGGATKSSGSTGQPVTVLHTQRSFWMYYVLKQRQMRWARFDPMGRIGMIRPPQDLPMMSKGRRVEIGQTVQRNSWAPQIGPFFETGPMFGFANRNSLESQMEWVEAQKLDYLIGQSAELEHLALGFQERPQFKGLRGIMAITQQLTPEMRQRVERVFRATVLETYGFNEIGIVANRCLEGGRFHVNTEHCLVEIVDADGNPCPPGQRGHLLATGLMNLAMPLIRYDSGDLAEPAEGPCPCGRTLPSFAAIHGRYRRIANLPADTFKYWAALRRALGDMPAELSKHLRQYQVHQYRDGRYALRLVVAGDLAPAFKERILAEWAETGAPEPPPLDILIVDEIPRPPGGKFQDFTSDYAPEPGSEAAAAPGSFGDRHD